MIHIPAEIETQLEDVACQTGESKDKLVQEALLSYLEDRLDRLDRQDRQDAASAEERLKNIGERTSLADLGKEFGLAD